MPKLRRPQLAPEARRRNLDQVARLGLEIRRSRLRRRLTQAQLGKRVGLAQATVSDLERGNAGAYTLDTLQRVALAVDRTLRIDLPRDPSEEPVDAGHLRIQELVLRSARAAGYSRRFELPTRPSDPSRSADVGLIDVDGRRLVVIECINTLGDFGAAVRSSVRKVAEARDFATARGGTYRVGLCWVVRDVRRNRALVSRYPEVFATQFPGSSSRWLLAMTTGVEFPDQIGMVWCDAAMTRLFAVRRSRP